MVFKIGDIVVYYRDLKNLSASIYIIARVTGIEIGERYMPGYRRFCFLNLETAEPGVVFDNILCSEVRLATKVEEDIFWLEILRYS
jgi:hypothetical protein